jgi:hypothetical protein
MTSRIRKGRGLVKLRLLAFAVVALMLPAESALAYQPVSGITSTEYNEGDDKAASFYNPLAVSAIDLTLPPASFNELNNTLDGEIQLGVLKVFFRH